ncbi:RagB/SusD family nutrient uptake outer membrane protein [Dyadobacter luteus]|uniref:RagB/SusD family nutrient uptake outer membrane protein n=1 Tax=Dyadobacter luteus TaxID=2259619 RepID=A0A3D8YCC1_9BACT|nr:RagB/SusD family nutrient uptake outer membrane protein [Dyadobacter luteus]REA62016.1 RagB/SusD family nutrient uptake outer membrane protein [Dyadobacter luteus]
MKRLSYIAILLGTATILPSCQDQLDLQPISQTVVGNDGTGTAGSSITNAATAESALAGAYAIFRNGSAEYYVMDYFIMGDGRSDNSYAGADNAAWFEVDEFRILSTNAVAARDWSYLYTHIASANAIINNVPKVTDAALTAERKAQMVGEAKFMRARAYFDLVRLYGDVPLVVHELPTITSSNIEEIYDQLYPSRTSADQVYAQIIKDLDEAVAAVPKSGTNKMTVTPGAVYTLLAKVHATKQDWAKVKTNTDAVIALGYSLLPNFEELWDGNHENSAEAIFELNFTDWATGGNWGSSMFYGTDWKKFNTPSNDLVKAYDDEKDVVRKASTIFTANVTGKWADKYWPLTTFPFAYKMRKTDASQNIIMYRFADVLLLKAEALNETGDLAGAKTLLNQVRTRAKLPANTSADQTSLRLAIEKERRLELAFEGQRWFDLVRTGRAIPVMQAVKDGNGNSPNYSLNEAKLLLPIPQGEMDKNVSLTQNQGY